EDPPLWCEGGHNPAALEAFVGEFKRATISGNKVLLVGFKGDKVIDESVAILAALKPAIVITTESPAMTPMPAETIATAFRQACPDAIVMAIPHLNAAIEHWLQALRRHPSPVGLVIGSLYLCGDVRNLLTPERLSATFPVPGVSQ
ncbi:MAG: hypothetical protein ABI743_14695, partial [bacterium]